MPTSINRRFLLASAIGVGLLGLGAFAVPSSSQAADDDASKGTIAGQVTTKPGSYKDKVVVHLVKAPGSFRPPSRPATIDQKGMKFVPHVLPVLRGTTVKFKNNDNVRHNVFTPDGEKYDLGTWPQGETRTYTYKKSGVYRQLCNVHPEMAAVILVLDNPYFAKTDSSGKFSIKGVPPGTYKVRAWGEKLKDTTKTVTVTAGATTTADFSLSKK